ncbi:hypothetical protein DPMN_188322 [Dreissena polymorpha]|uniref:Secreted protein n=1 Tax=Dreissena polymorpha TaxID=45954 RepID=A0A9D4DSQ5_DREPO|nr:hypothetical protein DPMN_188322 [Dreissena polymorpha]
MDALIRVLALLAALCIVGYASHTIDKRNGWNPKLPPLKPKLPPRSMPIMCPRTHRNQRIIWIRPGQICNGIRDCPCGWDEQFCQRCNGQNCLAIKDAKFDANTNTCICMASGSTHNPKKLGFS